MKSFFISGRNGDGVLHSDENIISLCQIEYESAKVYEDKMKTRLRYAYVLALSSKSNDKKETMSDDGEEIGGVVEAVESFFISGRNGDDVPHSDGNIISVSFSLCVLCRVFEFFLVGLGNFESNCQIEYEKAKVYEDKMKTRLRYAYVLALSPKSNDVQHGIELLEAKFLDKDEAGIDMTTYKSTAESNKLVTTFYVAHEIVKSALIVQLKRICSLRIKMKSQLSVNFILNLVSSDRGVNNKGKDQKKIVDFNEIM
ncbi:hypothetical protein HID58_014032 [Brassica napus]|uniref:14-3-3 domain-containing protein n=1 Tax=Brassica napus TaxID=3708 RepID=A0ABQ8DG08_BRANA|nr:hypothetical protein HID58_014032 [Brassica napus]